MPMKTKTKEIGKLVLIGLAMWLVLSTNAHAATTLTVCSASCSATTIGDAMDLAVDGDTISVLNGTYNEEVVLYNSVNLVGEDKNNVTISGARDCTEGGPIYNVVTILKASTNISGVTVTGGYNGITLSRESFWTTQMKTQLRTATSGTTASESKWTTPAITQSSTTIWTTTTTLSITQATTTGTRP
jgi:hypothetical protein